MGHLLKGLPPQTKFSPKQCILKIKKMFMVQNVCGFNIKLVFRTWNYPQKSPPDGIIVVFKKLDPRVLGITPRGYSPKSKSKF